MGLDLHTEKTERAFIKVLLGSLVGFILVISIVVGGYAFFKRWEARRVVKRAEAYLNWGDTKSAALAARRAFQLDSSSADACRVLAETAERDGEPAAVEWRQQVTTLRPNSTDDVIALARTALQFGRIETAEAALAKLRPGADQLPSYHEVEAQLAVEKKDPAAAERHFAEAVRLDPSRKVNQLNLAVFQLQSTSRETRDRASALLRQFLDDKSLRVPAARALRDYAAQRKDGPALVSIAELLSGYPEATFRDRISYLQVLQALDRPEFAPKLTELHNEAVGDPSKLNMLLSWMNSSHLALVAIDWSKRLPPESLNKPNVRVALADCYVAGGNASGLQQWCKKEKWDDLEFLRHAYLAWAARTQSDDLGFKSEWNSALQDAASNGERLYALEQEAMKWNWKAEAEDVLWSLTKDPHKQDAALAALDQYYKERGNTGQLYRVAARLCEIRPGDDNAQNNLADLSLLLNLNVETANETARQLHQKAPLNPVFASTYAFSLYRKGQYQQAVKIMSALKPADLEQPAMAAYYGAMLVAAGDKSKAAPYLERGSQARLLPEEKALVDQARVRWQTDRP